MRDDPDHHSLRLRFFYREAGERSSRKGIGLNAGPQLDPSYGDDIQLGRTLHDRFLRRLVFPESYRSTGSFASLHEMAANGVTT